MILSVEPPNTGRKFDRSIYSTEALSRVGIPHHTWQGRRLVLEGHPEEPQCAYRYYTRARSLESAETSPPAYLLLVPGYVKACLVSWGGGGRYPSSGLAYRLRECSKAGWLFSSECHSPATVGIPLGLWPVCLLCISTHTHTHTSRDFTRPRSVLRPFCRRRPPKNRPVS